ncbi:MAG: rhomboid family intramembrane serine protease [Bacteroidota bacterium]
MSYNFQPTTFKRLPDVIKNLIIINGLFFLGTIVLRNFGIDLIKAFGLFLPGSTNFAPHQFITHMFMHSISNPGHIFMNMFMLWMFGNMLENIWGAKRFLVFYMVTGLGAGLLYTAVHYTEAMMLQNQLMEAGMSQSDLMNLVTTMRYNPAVLSSVTEDVLRDYWLAFNTPVIGASGAVYGVLMAFGMIFPNMMIYIYFLFPIKAKWLVIILGAVEFFQGFNSSGSNVAHFAHLGGMLFGYLLIKYWQKKGMGNPMY